MNHEAVHDTTRTPDTLFLLGLLLAAGAGQLIFGAESSTVAALVSAWIATTWAITITIGAGLALAGILLPDLLAGLMIEATGRAMLAPASAAYAVALIGAGGANGALVAAMVSALALASAWRVWQIRRTLRAITAGLHVIAVHQADDAADGTGHQ